jgi:hypothetical protein
MRRVPCSHSSTSALLLRPFIDLACVGDHPIEGLLLGGKTVDAAFVAFVIPKDDMPAGALFVGKGQHHGFFFFGVRHAADYARFGRGRKSQSGLRGSD